MTKERGLLFTPENREKVIKGIKTQTRRVIKPLCSVPDFYHYEPGDPYPFYFRRRDAVWDSFKTIDELAKKYCPYGSTGDLYYLQEPTQIRHLVIQDVDKSKGFAIVQYDDGEEIKQQLSQSDINCLLSRRNWEKRSSCRFMLKSFARHWLVNCGVRVERLQDISEVDAISEGIIKFDYGLDAYALSQNREVIQHYYGTERLAPSCMEAHPREAFRRLWDSINADRGHGWDVNDLVWVVGFESKDNLSQNVKAGSIKVLTYEERIEAIENSPLSDLLGLSSKEEETRS